MRLKHPFDPIADARSEVLILGSFPSIKSFEKNFYYAHPRNAFWPIMETLFGATLPDSESRRRFVLERGIALWDVYGETLRTEGSSSDANLGAPLPNDIPGFLKRHPEIKHIFCTGRKAYDALNKAFPELKTPCTLLPSTSPAYAAMPFAQKAEAYRIVKACLDAD